jgi:amino acid transporter
VALATPRTLFALAGGILPSVITRVHPRFRTPYVAIVSNAIATIFVAAMGSFAALVPFASVAVVVLYLAVALASWELARRNVRTTSDPFQVPTIVPIVASAFCVWLLFHASRIELQLEAAVLAVATAVYYGRRLGRAISARS